MNAITFYGSVRKARPLTNPLTKPLTNPLTKALTKSQTKFLLLTKPLTKALTKPLPNPLISKTNYWHSTHLHSEMPFSTTDNPILQLAAIISSEESARDFLLAEGVLRSSVDCKTCSCPMVRKPCSPSKSADLLHWFCSPCRRSVIIREGSVFKGKKVSCAEFVLLLFGFSTKGISGSTISEFTQLGEDTVSIWRRIITDETTFWLIANCSPIGSVGKHAEIEEAKFRRMKHHRGTARVEDWVLAGVERETNRCFIVPCPGGK